MRIAVCKFSTSRFTSPFGAAVLSEAVGSLAQPKRSFTAVEMRKLKWAYHHMLAEIIKALRSAGML